jgi:hypothetical protein
MGGWLLFWRLLDFAFSSVFVSHADSLPQFAISG